jgi:hypothetical protein
LLSLSPIMFFIWTFPGNSFISPHCSAWSSYTNHSVYTHSNHHRIICILNLSAKNLLLFFLHFQNRRFRTSNNDSRVVDTTDHFTVHTPYLCKSAQQLHNRFHIIIFGQPQHLSFSSWLSTSAYCRIKVFENNCSDFFLRFFFECACNIFVGTGLYINAHRTITVKKRRLYVLSVK